MAAGTPGTSSWPRWSRRAAAELRRCPASRAVPGRLIQNVGAYGQEVSETIAGLRVLDRRSGEITTWPARAGFGYRDSFFKRNPGSYVVLAVAFDLPKAPAHRSSTPNWRVNWAWKQVVARRCAMCVRPSCGCGRAREWCSTPRTRTCSVGSFFTNPFVEVVPEGAQAGRSRTAGSRPAPHG